MRPAAAVSAFVLTGSLLITGCTSQASWTPTVDTYGNSRAQYLSQDTEECRSLARRASGDTMEDAGTGAAIGAFAGAAGGALIGSMVGRPGRGALLGAAAGTVGGGTVGATTTQADFKQAFSNCMRARGHNVIN